MLLHLPKMVKIIEVPTSNERPLWKSKNLISAQGS